MSSHSGEAPNTLHPATPVIYLLEELVEVLSVVSDEQYVQKPVGVMPGTIGGHVRHCLDHVQTLLQSVGTGLINYDDRKRGTDVETNRASALSVIREQADALAALPPEFMQASIGLRVMLTADGAPIEVESSLGRELAFVLSHTIHHNAIIGAMVKTLGLPVPERFGYAPSTQAFLNRTN